MLNPLLVATADDVIASNAMVLTKTWDPRLVLVSQLQVDQQGKITVIPNALERDKVKVAGSFIFETEKNILISHLNDFAALVNAKKDAIVGKETRTLPEYYNQSNALQGLIQLLGRLIPTYKNLRKNLSKAENKAKGKNAYKHLVSSDFQNLTLDTCVSKLDELIVELREAQQSVLTRNGQFGEELEDALDNPVFLLGEGIEAHIPFAEPTTSIFLRILSNPLCVGLKICATLNRQFRRMTVCPSWESETSPFIRGPSDYLLERYNQTQRGIISFTPVTLSVLIDFFENDNTLLAQPFVQVAIEIALRDDFRYLAIHAPNGCWRMLYSLGFRTKDTEAEESVTPTEQQQTDYFARPSTSFPVVYDMTQPMINIEANGEEFIHVTSLRVFHLDLSKLKEMPVLLTSNQPTTWHELIKNRRYLDPIAHHRILPEFNYLPYACYVPSFSALREREITGRLPPNRVAYEIVPAQAADINNTQALQSIGALDDVFDSEIDLSEKIVKLCRI